MLALERVGKTYPNGVHALGGVTLDVALGEIVAAIVAFAIVGKATDWLIVLAAAPFLRWEDVVRQD